MRISNLFVVLRTLKQQISYGGVRPFFGRTHTRSVVGVAHIRGVLWRQAN